MMWICASIYIPLKVTGVMLTDTSPVEITSVVLVDRLPVEVTGFIRATLSEPQYS